MKQFRLNELPISCDGKHILAGIMPGEYLAYGGLVFEKAGFRAHTNDGPGGTDYHVHEDCEAFVILQGKGFVEINKTQFHPTIAGDVIIIEPGEDHHLTSSEEDPLVVIWCHAGPERNEKQVISTKSIEGDEKS
ncbi:cupin domain-containing protein [Paenibacillus cremeus]|uniref:Cupin domain-containing protein n=1 Tax=Paenibacillus cremeus TaxID=2163881 RepID=A0A559K4W4_9BACL|nr:cupin domain-containing protein [Paenibacillus cremeus]TVY07174.1 cupin domain-containing protein [Paenibacillus cremeus]